jgi:hypothetical protein
MLKLRKALAGVRIEAGKWMVTIGRFAVLP